MEAESAAAGSRRRPVSPPYEMVRIIGTGGFGTVWLARSAEGTQVAMKVARDDDDREAIAVEMALLEKAGAGEDPGIVDVLDTLPDREPPAIVLGYCPESLRNRLAEHERLSWKKAIRILLPVARTVARAHARGVLHLDLKPENVLFREDGTPQVADFGLGRRHREGELAQSLASAPGQGGTLDYMAPEVRRREAPDARADAYALGVMLYETVSGQIPYGSFPGLAESVDPSIPEELDDLVRHALRPHPRERCTVEEFARKLEDLPHERAKADPARASTPVAGASNPAPAGVAILAGVSLALLLAIGVAVFAGRGAPAEPPIAVPRQGKPARDGGSVAPPRAAVTPQPVAAVDEPEFVADAAPVPVAPLESVRVANGDLEVTFSWDPIPGTEAYVLSIRPSEDEDAPDHVAHAREPMHVVPASKVFRKGPGRYRWTVCARSDIYSTPWSDPVEIDVRLEAPSPTSPSDGMEQVITVASGVEVAWRRVLGAQKYEVRLGKGEGPFNAERAEILYEGRETRCAFLPDRIGRYTFGVRARLAEDGPWAETPWSRPAAFFVRLPEARSAMEERGATGSYPLRMLHFYWYAVERADAYEIRIERAEAGPGTPAVHEATIRREVPDPYFYSYRPPTEVREAMKPGRYRWQLRASADGGATWDRWHPCEGFTLDGSGRVEMGGD